MVVESAELEKAKHEALEFLSPREKQRFVDREEYDAGTTQVKGIKAPVFEHTVVVDPQAPAGNGPKPSGAPLDLSQLKETLKSLDSEAFPPTEPVHPKVITPTPRFYERYLRPKVPTENARYAYRVTMPNPEEPGAEIVSDHHPNTGDATNLGEVVPGEYSAEERTPTPFVQPGDEKSLPPPGFVPVPREKAINPFSPRIVNRESPALEIPVLGGNAKQAVSNWYLRGSLEDQQVSHFDIEDCAGCRFVWTQVEKDVGPTRVQMEVFNSFQKSCQDVQLAPIFFPACVRMREYADDMMIYYLAGLTAPTICEQVKMCLPGSFSPTGG